MTLVQGFDYSLHRVKIIIETNVEEDYRLETPNIEGVLAGWCEYKFVSMGWLQTRERGKRRFSDNSHARKIVLRCELWTRPQVRRTMYV